MNLPILVVIGWGRHIRVKQRLGNKLESLVRHEMLDVVGASISFLVICILPQASESILAPAGAGGHEKKNSKEVKE